jgi:HEPN domain-containing protein
MKEEIKVFLERAEIFEREAKLLEIKGSFERTHSLRRLLLELAEKWDRKEIENFIQENKEVLRNMERAYISSRYIYEEFFEEEVKKAFEVVEKLKKLLWKG